MFMKNTYRDALSHCKKTVAVSVFTEAFQRIVTIGTAMVIGEFSDAIFNQDIAYVYKNMSYLIVCVLANVLLVPLICYFGDTVCIKESIKYDINMFNRFLGLKYEYASKIPLGEVKSRLESDVIMFRNSIILVLAKAIVVPISLAALIFLMWRVNTVYMIISLILSVLALIIPEITKSMDAKYDNETHEYEAKANTYSYELIILSPFVKLYRLGKKIQEDYNNLFVEFYETTKRKSIILNCIVENVPLVFAVLANIIVLIVGSILLSMGLVSAGDIVKMLGYYTTLLTVIESLGFIISRTARLKKLDERMKIFYDNEDDETEQQIKSDNLLPLCLKNVSYQMDGSCILKNISFTILPKQKIAIVGKNGTGKTTLLNILTGLYSLYDGQVISGDKELREIPIDILAKSYSFVSQTPFVFNGTIKENVEFGSNNHDEMKLEQVLKDLGLFEMRDYVINSQMSNLSGGELQRISIARALLRDRQVVIMDEPNNNLDTMCVKWIKNYIKTSNKTILYVTHDDEMICMADYVVNLNN